MPAGRRRKDSSGSSESAQAHPVSAVQKATSADVPVLRDVEADLVDEVGDVVAHLLGVAAPRREAEHEAARRPEDHDRVADRPDPGGAERLGPAGRLVDVVDVEVEVDAARPVGDRLHLEPGVTARREQGRELVVVAAGRRQGPSGHLRPERATTASASARGVSRNSQAQRMSVIGRPRVRCSWQAVTRSTHQATRCGGAAHRSRRSSSTATRPVASDPWRGTSGSRVTSPSSRATVPRPQACVQLGQGRRERDPGGDADARVERRRDDRGQPAVLHDAPAPPAPRRAARP